MDAVILVAREPLEGDPTTTPGFAQRIGGLTLLNRAMRCAQRAGATRLIVIGPDMAEFHAAMAPDKHVSIPVEVWIHRRDATELSAALSDHGEHLPERFWLTTSDRLLSPAAFGASEAEDGAAVRFVDDTHTPIGTYQLTRAIVEQLARQPASTVDALVRALQGTHSPVDIELAKVTWCAVEAVDDIPLAWAALRRSLRKPLGRNADGLAAYYLNRPMSLAMSRHLVQTSVTPNQITAIALAIGLAAAVLVAQGGHTMLILGGLALQFSSVLDGVDGELARMRLTSSHLGEWFDTVCDDVTNISFMVGLGVAATSRTGNPLWWNAALVGALCGTILAGLLYRELLRAGIASHNNLSWEFEAHSDAKPSWIRRFLVGFSYIAKRDSYTVLLLLLMVLDLPRVALTIMVVGTVAIFIGYFVQKARSARTK